MSARVPDLLVVNVWVVTMDPERRQFRRGYVAVSGDRITSVGSVEDRRDDRAGQTIDAAGCAVRPGFINAHTHAVYNLLRGGLSDDCPLYEWLLNVVHPRLKAMTTDVGPGGPEPVFRCTAVTMRRDAIYQAGLTGIPVTENHVPKLLPMEENLSKALHVIYPEIIGVHYAPKGGAEFLAIAGLRQRYVNQARTVILSALGSVAHPKMVIVVDDYIDIYNPTEVWCRSSPARNRRMTSSSSRRPQGGSWTRRRRASSGSSLMGIATRPFGEPFPEVVRSPGLENVPRLERLGAAAVTGRQAGRRSGRRSALGTDGAMHDAGGRNAADVRKEGLRWVTSI